MTELYKKIDGIKYQIDTLYGRHNEFIEFLKKQAQSEQFQYIGKIVPEDTGFSVICLDVKLKVRIHPVIVEADVPVLIEYAFVANLKDEDLTVFTMYLDHVGYLHKDHCQKERLTIHTGRSTISDIIYALADSLLTSKLFAPSPLSV